MLHREFNPENHSKSLMWRRSLLSPKFPAKEEDFSAAMQEWEADLHKYEAEYGSDKAISDEDKRAVIITEAPNALKQHLAMHLDTLDTYEAVRQLVVSYLQAKRVWTPTAAYAGIPAPKDHNAMDIGKVGDHQQGKGKKGDRVARITKKGVTRAKGKRVNPRMAEERALGSPKMKSQDVPFAGRHHIPLTSVGTTPKDLHKERKGDQKEKCRMFTMEMVVSLCSVRVLPPAR